MDGIGPAGKSEGEQRRRDHGDRHTDQDAGGGGRGDREEPGAPACGRCEADRGEHVRVLTAGREVPPERLPDGDECRRSHHTGCDEQAVALQLDGSLGPFDERAGGLDVAPFDPPRQLRDHARGIGGVVQSEPQDGADLGGVGQRSTAEVGAGHRERVGRRIVDEVERQPDDADHFGVAELDPLEGFDRHEALDRCPRPDLEPVLVGRPFVDHDLVGAPRSGVPPGDEQRPSETAR